MSSRDLPTFLPTETPVDLVCVTYEGDARLMVLQMLSVDRLLDHRNLGRYMIVLNGADNSVLEEYLRAHTFPRLSEELRAKVEFVHGKAVLGGTTAGWRDQQAIKILVANLLGNDHYLLLDAKNHFIRPTLVAEFFLEGRPKTELKPMSDEWVQYLRHSLRQFRALTEENLQVLPPTVTPYVMIRAEALEAVRRIEHSTGQPFTSAFDAMGPKATEFFLYYSHFISEGGSFPYADAPPMGSTLYAVHPISPEGTHRRIQEAAENNHAVFGLHRKRLPQLTDGQRRDIAKLWGRHLLLEWEDAGWFKTYPDTLG